MNEQQMAELIRIKDEFEKNTDSSDVKLIAETDEKFHDIIYESTDNAKLVVLLNNLREQIYRYRVEYLKNKDNYPALIQEHEEIVEALKAHDKDKVTEAMHKHVMNQAMAVKEVIQMQDQRNQE